MLQKYNHLFGNCCSDPLLIHKKGISKSFREITVEKYNGAKIIPGKFLCTNCWTKTSYLSCETDSNNLAYEPSSRTIENSLGKKWSTSFDVPYVEEGLFVELDNSDKYSILINKLTEKMKSGTSVKDKIKMLSLLLSRWSKKN
ncbi:hypothetical protein PR048_005290 [Dryococelus australis]|uniref:Uncharacterized protein n=1 Tax=Dryococelus australis TaxID=614101 RepID=A0ABQ9I7U6_9NEOP|nr:hypothetical protein PR048_005290 [Dryococelus australis]